MKLLITWVEKGRAPNRTALEVMHIFVDWEAEWEQMCKDLLAGQVDEVVDAGHRIDDGENVDFNGNLDS